MNFLYKDYERPTYVIHAGGYFLPLDYTDESNYPKMFGDDYVSNEVSDYVVMPENNLPYFDEAAILEKINNNEEEYFDFNKAILDIGAHAGVYSFRSKFKYVYAFEPNKKMFVFLNINLMMHNKYFNSKTFNVLLSDKNEILDYDGFTVYQTDQHLPDFVFNNDTAENTYSHTIDEYNLTNIGFIKIDVEGMEEKVLRGALGTIIRNNYPPILFECWPVGFYEMTEEKRNSLKEFLENLGYDIQWEWGDYETHLALHK